MERAVMWIRDRAAALAVQQGLADIGFEGTLHAELASLLRCLRREECRLLVLDVDVPGGEWQAVIEQVREASPRPVVVGVGALPHAAARALDAGADEFVPLPLSRPELCSRVQAALRRADHAPAPTPALLLNCGPCVLDTGAHKLVSARAVVELTTRETGLARQLFQVPGGLVSRRALARFWEIDEDLAGRTIEQHVYQLRRKLRLCVGEAVVLRSVYARGYRLEHGATVYAPITASADPAFA